jgi:hypothetical protein
MTSLLGLLPPPLPLGWVSFERTEGQRGRTHVRYNEQDGGLSTSHAIMRGGPQVRLSPDLGADCVSRRLRP